MSIPTLTIESSNCITDLCNLGSTFYADKSPLNTMGHRHPYTPVYSLLFSQYQYQPVRFAEIGVAGGASVMLWNNFFEKGELFFFDRDENFLQNGRTLSYGRNALFYEMDVIKPESIRSALEKTGGNLDILLDDSSHNPTDQNHIIREALPFIRPGGTILIEDVSRGEPESTYEEILKDIRNEFSFVSFILTEHINKFSPGWDNDKLLVLIKK